MKDLQKCLSIDPIWNSIILEAFLSVYVRMERQNIYKVKNYSCIVSLSVTEFCLESLYFIHEVWLTAI